MATLFPRKSTKMALQSTKTTIPPRRIQVSPESVVESILLTEELQALRQEEQQREAPPRILWGLDPLYTCYPQVRLLDLSASSRQSSIQRSTLISAYWQSITLTL